MGCRAKDASKAMPIPTKGQVVKILLKGQKHYAVVAGFETKDDNLFIKCRTVTYDNGAALPGVTETDVPSDEVRDVFDTQECVPFVLLRQMVGIPFEKTSQKVLKPKPMKDDDDTDEE